MASFYSIFGFLAVNSFDSSEPGTFDMLDSLPFEMATSILRLLSGKDLLNAACVSRKWLNICRNDRKLRQKIRRHLRQLRKERLASLVNNDFARNTTARPSVRPSMMTIENTAINTYYRPNSYVGPEARTDVRFMPYKRESLSAVRPRKIRKQKEFSLRCNIRM